MLIVKSNIYSTTSTSLANCLKICLLHSTVNRNLVGVGPAGCMTADQKKKLLWGNKKNTTAEEVPPMVYYFQCPRITFPKFKFQHSSLFVSITISMCFACETYPYEGRLVQ